MAKLISDNSGGNAQWDNSLIKDLAFIKKHLRYPFNKRTLSSAIVVGLMLAFISRMVIIILILKNRSDLGKLFMSALIVLSIVVTLLGYLRSLKFITIHDPFFSAKNQHLIMQFLKSQHLVVFRHPDAPEVFQIISKSISATKDKREVMIFIADEKRILVNSHFPNNGFSLTPPSKHSRLMANRLDEWIKMHHADPENQAVAVQYF